MKAAVLLSGFISFAGCLTFHVVLWRIGRPRSDAWALFVIFLVVPTMVGLALLVTALVVPGGPLPPALDVAAILLLHCALAAAYIQTYPAAQAQSPSLEIAYAVAKSMPRGLSRADLLAALSPDTLVHSRVDDLVANRLIRADGDRYVLTPLSARLIRAFLKFRSLLGLRKQGG